MIRVFKGFRREPRSLQCNLCPETASFLVSNLCSVYIVPCMALYSQTQALLVMFQGGPRQSQDPGSVFIGSLEGDDAADYVLGFLAPFGAEILTV